MKLSDALEGLGKTVAYYPSLARLIGVKETILFCQFFFWVGKERGKDVPKDGWIYKTQEEITAETGLSRSEQEMARKSLKRQGLWEEKHARLEHKMFYRPIVSRLDEIWEVQEKTRKSYAPERGNSAPPNAVIQHSGATDHSIRSLSENTAENTAENTTEGEVTFSSFPNRNGEENGNGGEPKNAEPALTPEGLVALYNELTPDECPAVQILSPARKEKARKYLKQFPDRTFWAEVFEQVGYSYFLRGQSLASKDRASPFRADFDWLLQKGQDGTENFIKVHDGKYVNRR